MKQIVRKTVPTIWNAREEFVTPFSLLFDKIVNTHFPEFKEDYAINFAKGTYPKVDVIDHETSTDIIAEIAGWKKEDIKIEVDKGILTISGTNTIENKGSEGGTYIVKEIKRSSFTRSFVLNEKLNENDINATFENGTLKVSIGKFVPEEIQTKKLIEIQ